ncbi:MAG: GNAT family N-acetyltransferase [Planctomycetota bacterium]|nr:GNAT family N-acetyltransferase [Planctomycetota bacterium]
MEGPEIVVVLAPDGVDGISDLVGDSPLWIVRSAPNDEAVRTLLAARAAERRRTVVTTFDCAAITTRSLADLFETIDLHHGSWSSDPPWRALVLIGDLDDVDAAGLARSFGGRIEVEVTRIAGGLRVQRVPDGRLAGAVSQVRLRAAGLADIDAMHVVRCAVRENRLSRPDRITSEDYRFMLERDGRGWVAEVDGRVVGFVVADLCRFNVWALFVDPEHEKRGIGRVLHDAMMEWFLAQPGVERVWLTTAPGTRAEAFYRRAGWRYCGLDAAGEVRFEMDRPVA